MQIATVGKAKEGRDACLAVDSLLEVSFLHKMQSTFIYFAKKGSIARLDHASSSEIHIYKIYNQSIS